LSFAISCIFPGCRTDLTFHVAIIILFLFLYWCPFPFNPSNRG
jgi:hypothetical protein